MMEFMCRGVHYKILLIPGCEYLPLSVARYIVKEKEHTICIFVGQRPKGICEETAEEPELLETLKK